MSNVRRMAVFSCRKNAQTGAVVWIRMGNAVVNRDGSINAYLDALPLDGKIHLQETNAAELADAEIPHG